MLHREAKNTISSPKIAATTGSPTKPTLPNAVTSRVAPTSSLRVRQKPRHDDLQHSRRREHEDIIDNFAAGEIRHTQHGIEDRRREQDVHHQRRDTLIELRPRDADARTKVAKEHDEHQHGHLGKQWTDSYLVFSLFSNSLVGRRMVLSTQYKIVYARHRVL